MKDDVAKGVQRIHDVIGALRLAVPEGADVLAGLDHVVDGVAEVIMGIIDPSEDET